MTGTSLVVTPEELADTNVRLVCPETLMVVSLERAQPFLPDLGLKLGEVSATYPALREFVCEREAWMHTNVDDDAPVAPYLARQLTQLFGQIKASAGEGAVSSLRAAISRSIAFDRTEPWRRAWSSLS